MFPVTGTSALILAIVFGFAFGWLLQRGRVTDYNTIVNQFRLRDFTVLKVMLTAIVVGGIGVLALTQLGYAKFAVRDANMLGTIIGAAIFGIGMVLLRLLPRHRPCGHRNGQRSCAGGRNGHAGGRDSLCVLV
jgi:uncharacterized membrane protein YedE/YeeE